jgi:hypothetical protein
VGGQRYWSAKTNGKQLGIAEDIFFLCDDRSYPHFFEMEIVNTE